MRIVRFLAVLLLMISMSAVAVAQEGDPIVDEDLGIEVWPPDAWDDTSDEDSAVANFKHDDTKSQIQLIATPLMNDEVADVFFETFHSTLQDSAFEEQSREDKGVGDLEGTAVDYAFEHSGVTLQIKVFEFLHDDTAYLAIGYLQDEGADDQIEAYQSVLENISFENDE